MGIGVGLRLPNCAMDVDDAKLLKVILGPEAQGFTLHQQCRPSGDEQQRQQAGQRRDYRRDFPQERVSREESEHLHRCPVGRGGG